MLPLKKLASNFRMFRRSTFGSPNITLLSNSGSVVSWKVGFCVGNSK